MQYEIRLHATWVGWHLGTYVTSLRPYICFALYLSRICLIVAPSFCLDFLWSGILIFVFSFGSWLKICSTQKNAASSGPRSLQQSKQRLLNIAMEISACLLLNMVRYTMLWSSFKPDSMIQKLIHDLPMIDFVGCYHHHTYGPWGMEHHDEHLAHLWNNRDIFCHQVMQDFLGYVVLKPVQFILFFLGIGKLTD